jgi:hypothetical protein
VEIYKYQHISGTRIHDIKKINTAAAVFFKSLPINDYSLQTIVAKFTCKAQPLSLSVFFLQD